MSRLGPCALPTRTSRRAWQDNFFAQVRKEKAGLILEHPGRQGSLELHLLILVVFAIVEAKLQAELVAFPNSHEISVCFDRVSKCRVEQRHDLTRVEGRADMAAEIGDRLEFLMCPRDKPLSSWTVSRTMIAMTITLSSSVHCCRLTIR